ncbi:hypothetical protein OJF2_69510 [Aquisphaera giovannonii]|uniref:Uncharacterized protein n=1 Tax=Aquisphaera giovannonii TaxID=406548 RepID=A0A5B9WEP1_9BACT|nr:hypothetical protein [Aquisphaera giovannonii]QEH38350.1 hypothetical protein OJF2_69510 [Aquisphaera giovannonii]
MIRDGERWRTWGRAVLLGVSALMLAVRSPWASHIMILALGAAVPTWFRAWRASAGTALRGALVWGAVAIGLAMAVQGAAILEGPRGGGVWTGRVAYLMTLSVLAGLISVLGAREPGGGAWAILMVLLVVVFLIPWLEGGGRVRRGEGAADLRLLSPWTLFYGLLATAGVTNYLPTRYGPAAAALGVGLGLEYLGLTRPGWDAETRKQASLGVAWCLAAAAGLAGRAGARPLPASSRADALWRWFRDGWGVVWALRVQERFNRSAELAGWPIRLTWYGLAPAGEGAGPAPTAEIPEAAEATLRSLIRRFATPERSGLAARSGGPEACHGGGPAG